MPSGVAGASPLAGIVEAREAVEGLRGRRGSGRFAAALAMDLLAPSPRSVAYLAGQVLGGTAFSEEDPVSRMYRDASMLTRLPIQVSEAWDEVGERALATLTPGDARLLHRLVVQALALALAPIAARRP